MLPTRGVYILKTYARVLDTFVVAEECPRARAILRKHACVLHNATGGVALHNCPFSARSYAVLVRNCGGLEEHGCCRVFRFLDATTLIPLSHLWVVFVDDDVYVPDCLQAHLPIGPSLSTPLFAPSKHVGARGGWRWSLCGEKGRPDAEIALPAGYGFANRAFVAILRHSALNMIRQCATTPSYNFDVSLAFASWWKGVDLTAAFDWTDPRVYWTGGQRHLWRNSSWIFHKARSQSDFVMLHGKRDKMCGVAHANVTLLFAERRAQTGYARTRHARTPRLRVLPFDCQ